MMRFSGIKGGQLNPCGIMFNVFLVGVSFHKDFPLGMILLD